MTGGLVGWIIWSFKFFQSIITLKYCSDKIYNALDLHACLFPNDLKSSLHVGSMLFPFGECL